MTIAGKVVRDFHDIMHISIAFRYKALQLSDGLHDMGTINWPIFGCLIAIEVFCFFCIFKGVKLTGKVNITYTVQITAVDVLCVWFNFI